MADVRPGSWVGDTVEEFKKLPPWGKILAGGILVAVAGLGYMRFRAGQNAGPGAASTGGAVGSAGSLLPATNDPSTVIGTAGNPVIGAPGPPGPPGPPGVPNPPTGIFTTGPTPPGVPAPKPPPIPIPAPKPPPPPPPRQPPPPPKLQYYTVVHGDNLSEIAAKLHIRGGWQAIYNNAGNRAVIGSNPNLIYANQRLNLTGLI